MADLIHLLPSPAVFSMFVGHGAVGSACEGATSAGSGSRHDQPSDEGIGLTFLLTPDVES